MEKETEFEIGSGNVFEDLGFDDPILEQKNCELALEEFKKSKESTFEKEMKDPEFKAKFDKTYAEFMKQELKLISSMINSENKRTEGSQG